MVGGGVVGVVGEGDAQTVGVGDSAAVGCDSVGCMPQLQSFGPTRLLLSFFHLLQAGGSIYTVISVLVSANAATRPPSARSSQLRVRIQLGSLHLLSPNFLVKVPTSPLILRAPSTYFSRAAGSPT